MPISGDYQLDYLGLVLGAGTDYEIVEIRGIDDLVEMRTSDIERPAEHGLFAGTDFAAGRTVEIDLEVTGTTDAAFRANVQALADKTVIQSAESPLVFRLPSLSSGLDRRINARPRRRVLPVNLDYFFRIAPARLAFFAVDPRVYSDAETTLTTAAATSGGGRTYARVYPLTYAAGGTGGTLVATNAGNFPTRPTLVVTGPCDTPKIENVTAGRHLQVAVVLASGDFLEIDTDARTVLLNGTASRYSSLSQDSSWWELAPGASSLKFTSASNVGTLEIHFRSAWL